MKVGVIADDLTGANATGVRIAKQGFLSATVVYNHPLPTTDSLNAICIDTDSRYTNSKVANERVLNALQRLQTWGADVICKRIDSTVRGNIGVEIDTLLSMMGEKSIAIVVPSFPDSGRITLGGYLLVEGVPVQSTDVAKDPIKPITQSYIPDLIQEQSEYPVSHIGLQTVLSGKEEIVKELRKNISCQKRVIVVDAVTDEEIESIAEAMTAIQGYDMVPVDPGPLTAMYARAYAQEKTEDTKMIVAVGSVTSLSKLQVQYLIDKTKSSPIHVDAKKLLFLGEEWDQEVNRAVDEALAHMQKEDVLIITTQSPTKENIDIKKIASKHQMEEDVLAKNIADGLAKVTHLVMEQSPYPIGGCFSSGGDVSASLCTMTKAEGIKVEEEVLPLTSYGKLIGGAFHGKPIVTKGGLIGDKQAIYQSIKFLSTKLVKRGNKK